MENIFGETLRKLRKQFKMTQKDLANHIGVSEMTIRRFESGERVPKMPTIEALADFFDVTPQYMLFGDETSANIHSYVIQETEKIKDKFREDKTIPTEYINNWSEKNTLKVFVDKVLEDNPSVGEEFLLIAYRAMTDEQKANVLYNILCHNYEKMPGSKSSDKTNHNEDEE